MPPPTTHARFEALRVAEEVEREEVAKELARKQAEADRQRQWEALVQQAAAREAEQLRLAHQAFHNERLAAEAMISNPHNPIWHSHLLQVVLASSGATLHLALESLGHAFLVFRETTGIAQRSEIVAMHNDAHFPGLVSKQHGEATSCMKPIPTRQSV